VRGRRRCSTFERRTELPGVPRRRINIYAAADVLGSDFTDQPERSWRPAGRGPAPPTPSGIVLSDKQRTLKRPDVNERYGRSETLEQYSAMEKLGFLGFSMHRQYWEETSAGCYRNIVRAMFKGDQALA
jgi:hypothetical protein